MAELFVGLENGQKKLIPTSSEARSGNPLGTILAIHSNAVPYGYLPCNGVAFDEHQYPALYALLGDNHTPYSYDKSRLSDYEDFALTTTNQEMLYDGVMIVQTKVNYTIPTQIVYVNDIAIGDLHFDLGTGGTVDALSTIPFRKGDNIKISNTTNVTAKVAYYTHFNVIKATSGLEETQQDYVLQLLLEADNYSTDEVATGKKWIDGKMIYRKVLNYSVVNLPSQGWTSVAQDTMNIEVIIDICNFGTDGISGRSVLGRINNGYIQMFSPYGWSSVGMIIEYTKAD
jgi:hypothetical protein